MDPQATIKQFADAIMDGDLDTASECEANYHDWINKGGFPAEYHGNPILKLSHETDEIFVGGDKDRWVDIENIIEESWGNN